MNDATRYLYVVFKSKHSSSTVVISQYPKIVVYSMLFGRSLCDIDLDKGSMCLY